MILSGNDHKVAARRSFDLGFAVLHAWWALVTIRGLLESFESIRTPRPGKSFACERFKILECVRTWNNMAVLNVTRLYLSSITEVSGHSRRLCGGLDRRESVCSVVFRPSTVYNFSLVVNFIAPSGFAASLRLSLCRS